LRVPTRQLIYSALFCLFELLLSADAVGLALSIVSTKRERQWYHKCNRPDRGRGCTATELTSKGGCTIWFSELDMLAQIEKILSGVMIPKVDRMAVQRGAQHIAELASKGRRRQDEAHATSEAHVKALKPQVEELYRLEVRAQNTYLQTRHSLPDKWAGMLRQSK
jgi:ATP-dependent RNA helicase DDX1